MALLVCPGGAVNRGLSGVGASVRSSSLVIRSTCGNGVRTGQSRVFVRWAAMSSRRWRGQGRRHGDETWETRWRWICSLASRHRLRRGAAVARAVLRRAAVVRHQERRGVAVFGYGGGKLVAYLTAAQTACPLGERPAIERRIAARSASGSHWSRGWTAARGRFLPWRRQSSRS
jgi:hypothetical protein